MPDFPRGAATTLLTALLLSGPAMAQRPQFFSGGGPPKPFSAAVRAGNVVYASGAIGLDAQGQLPPDFPSQARNAMLNVARELSAARAGMGDVFRCEVALTDMNQFVAFNRIYLGFFRDGAYPARMTTGVSALVRGAAVEVACDAYRP
ncbi:RidA family protein [Rhizosaccharibacter radicis]|uniref:RidA family protein n=1 Tax=Rhizosaccharibacter radicis TaxID=2782605 RepID=A0ABT1VYY9_9PROT|nr:RidA family protein [Acetobacteraceae bacterium KSS12]